VAWQFLRMESAKLTRVSGFTLFFPAVIGLGFGGVPTVLGPFPALTVLPAFLLSARPLSLAVLFVPVLLFFAWNPGLFRGAPKIPKRSYVLLGLATVLSIFWFLSGGSYAPKYQGAQFTYFVCIVNFAWIAFLWAMFARAWKVGSSFKTNLFLHCMLFAWLAWYAFPYLGELPERAGRTTLRPQNHPRYDFSPLLGSGGGGGVGGR
jgi:hypothetical protein